MASSRPRGPRQKPRSPPLQNTFSLSSSSSLESSAAPRPRPTSSAMCSPFLRHPLSHSTPPSTSPQHQSPPPSLPRGPAPSLQPNNTRGSPADSDDDSDADPTTQELDYVMKSFEIEIAAATNACQSSPRPASDTEQALETDPASVPVVDLTTESGESNPDPGYLLEALASDLDSDPIRARASVPTLIRPMESLLSFHIAVFSLSVHTSSIPRLQTLKTLTSSPHRSHSISPRSPMLQKLDNFENTSCIWNSCGCAFVGEHGSLVRCNRGRSRTRLTPNTRRNQGREGSMLSRVVLLLHRKFFPADFSKSREGDQRAWMVDSI